MEMSRRSAEALLLSWSSRTHSRPSFSTVGDTGREMHVANYTKTKGNGRMSAFLRARNAARRRQTRSDDAAQQ